MDELLGQLFGGIFSFLAHLVGGVIEGIFDNWGTGTGDGTSGRRLRRDASEGQPETPVPPSGSDPQA